MDNASGAHLIVTRFGTRACAKSTWRRSIGQIGLAACLVLLSLPLRAQWSSPPTLQIEQLVDSCPASDPALSRILTDFDIRRNDVPVTQFPCAEPYTQTPVDQFAYETFTIQYLRLLYWIDKDQPSYLPWTSLRLYDWVVQNAKMAGINICTNPGVLPCNSTFNGREYMVDQRGANPSVQNRQYWLSLAALLQNVALLAHEARHGTGNGYRHVSCCGIANGCDQTYDEKNLSAYGIQYYLLSGWLTGRIDVSLGCLDPISSGQHWFSANGDVNIYATRFCDTKPPALASSTKIGGACQPGPYPYINAGGVVSAANSGAVAAGSAVSIYGPNLAERVGQAQVVPLPTTLRTVKVAMGATAAPLYYVSPLQINIQAPYEAAGSTPVTVTAAGNRGFRRYVTVKNTAPAFFVTTDGFVIAQDQNYALISTAAPARLGTYAVIYFTGQGASDNPVATGAAAPVEPLARPKESASVTIGGLTQHIEFIGLTPGFVGLSQLNVLIDSHTPIGVQPIVLTVGGVSSVTAQIAIGP